MVNYEKAEPLSQLAARRGGVRSREILSPAAPRVALIRHGRVTWCSSGPRTLNPRYLFGRVHVTSVPGGLRDHPGCGYQHPGRPAGFEPSIPTPGSSTAEDTGTPPHRRRCPRSHTKYPPCRVKTHRDLVKREREGSTQWDSSFRPAAEEGRYPAVALAGIDEDTEISGLDHRPTVRCGEHLRPLLIASTVTSYPRRRSASARVFPAIGHRLPP